MVKSCPVPTVPSTGKGYFYTDDLVVSIELFISHFVRFRAMECKCMLTLRTCRSLDTCFLTLCGKHYDQSFNIYCSKGVCV